MLTFLAVPLVILIVCLVIGFVVVAIQKRIHRDDPPGPAQSRNPRVSPKAQGS